MSRVNITTFADETRALPSPSRGETRFRGTFKAVIAARVDDRRSGMFVAQVLGKSMEPIIPDGAYCLFTSPVTGTRQGKTVLVELLDDIDPETGERYAVKRYESTKAPAGDAWRHEHITLHAVNPAFGSIELAAHDADRLRVVAELTEVLGAGS